MKKFVSKVQRLNQKAADFRQVAENAQPKIGELREAVISAVGQVQKLRSEMAAGVSPLRAENDGHLVALLREIDGASAVLAEAGVRVAEVEMDLGLNRRLIVRLDRLERVEPARLRALLNTHDQEPALKALLNALLNADELAKTIELTHLNYQRLTVEVGLIPSARIGWRPETPAADLSAASNIVRSSTLAPISSATLNAGSTTSANSGPASMFQRRPIVASTPLPALPAEDSHVVAPSSSATPAAIGSLPQVPRTPSPQPPVKDTRSQALDRFKKMPDLTKRPR